MLPLGLVKWKQLGFYIKYSWNIWFNKFQSLVMLHSITVQCRKLWIIWSSLRTKIFHVILCFGHFKVPSIFSSSSYILHNPRTYFKNIMSRYCCLMELANGNNNIWKILVQNKFHIYIYIRWKCWINVLSVINNYDLITIFETYAFLKIHHTVTLSP